MLFCASLSARRQPRTPLASAAALVVILVGCLLAQLAGSAPASAHDTLVSSTPADGVTLARAPTAVVLRFDEPVGRKFGAVIVTGPDGERVQSGALRVQGVRAVQALRPLQAAGLYHVAWRVVSADGHPVSGTLAFRLREGAAFPAAAPKATPGPGAAAGQDPASGRRWVWAVAAAAATLAVTLGVGLTFVARSRARMADQARERLDGD